VAFAPMLSDPCDWSWVCTVGRAIAVQLAYASKMPVPTEFTSETDLTKIVELKSRVEVENATPWHLVAKVRLTDKTVYRVRITAYLDYTCDCLWFQQHRLPCKHILATVLKVLEEAKIITNPKMETYDFFVKAVYRVAYAKSKLKP
jgi:hypothetical protein